jgi:hypothetical protein
MDPGVHFKERKPALYSFITNCTTCINEIYVKLLKTKTMLEALNFSIIDSDQLVPFGKNILGLFVDYDLEKNLYAAAPFVKKARNAYTNFSLAYERDLKNPFTIALSKSNTARGKAFLGFKNFVIAYTNSDEDTIQEAASRLQRVIERHGWRAAHLGYQSQTSAITKMINEINHLYLADVTLIGATYWFNKLVSTEQAFEDTEKAKATQPPSTMPTIAETRPVLEDGLRVLTSTIDNQYNVNTADTVLAQYVSSINEYIVTTMTIARAAETRDENDKKEETPKA